MSTPASNTTSSTRLTTGNIDGTADLIPAKKGDGGFKFGKRIDGAKGKEIKNDWLTSISNVNKQLTEISKELDEISKEIEKMSKRFDDIKKNAASKSGTRNTTTSVASSDPLVESSRTDEVGGDSAEESEDEIKNYLDDALERIKVASTSSKLIANNFKEKVQAEVEKAVTALNNFDSNESSAKDEELIKMKNKLNQRLQALLRGLEKIDLSADKANLQINPES
jgi:hypothetical protein